MQKHVCVSYVSTYACTDAWMSESFNLQKKHILSWYVSSQNQTEVIRFGSKWLYLLRQSQAYLIFVLFCKKYVINSIFV